MLHSLIEYPTALKYNTSNITEQERLSNSNFKQQLIIAKNISRSKHKVCGVNQVFLYEFVKYFIFGNRDYITIKEVENYVMKNRTNKLNQIL